MDFSKMTTEQLEAQKSLFQEFCAGKHESLSEPNQAFFLEMLGEATQELREAKLALLLREE